MAGQAAAVAPRQSFDGLGDLPLGNPAHLRDHAREVLEIGFEAFDCVSGESHELDPTCVSSNMMDR